MIKTYRILTVIILITNFHIALAQTPGHYYHQPSNVGVNNLYFNNSVCSKFVMIYTLAEMQAMVTPVAGPISIDTIYLRSNTATGINFTDFKIQIGHSTLATPVANFAANFNSGAPQLVLNAATYFMNSLSGAWNVPDDKWIAIPINSFNYNFTNNLAIQMEYNTCSYPTPLFADNGGIPIVQYSLLNSATNASGTTARPMFGIGAGCNLGLGNDFVLCAGDTVVVQINPTFSNYNWSNGATTSTITVTNAGIYIATAIAPCGFLIDSIEVIAGNIPLVNLGVDTTICFGDSIALEADSNYTSYLWSNGATSSSITINAAGIYFLMASDGICTATDSIIIAIGNCAPSISFQSSDTNFCEKKCIDFYDLSTNNPTSWQWLFPGADSLTSSLQNPTNICYNTYGSFDVTLIACNGFGCDTVSLPGFINEYQTPVPVVTQSNDTLFSTPAVSYQWWSVGNGIIAGATNYYYVPTQGGDYYVIISDSVGCAGTSNVIIITGINQLATGNGLIAIVPNPNNGNFSITFNHPVKEFSLRIYNAMGQLISFENKNMQTVSANGNILSIDLGKVPDGFYSCELIAGSQVYRQLFIIAK